MEVAKAHKITKKFYVLKTRCLTLRVVAYIKQSASFTALFISLCLDMNHHLTGVDRIFNMHLRENDLNHIRTTDIYDY